MRTLIVDQRWALTVDNHMLLVGWLAGQDANGNTGPAVGPNSRLSHAFAWLACGATAGLIESLQSEHDAGYMVDDRCWMENGTRLTLHPRRSGEVGGVP